VAVILLPAVAPAAEAVPEVGEEEGGENIQV